MIKTLSDKIWNNNQKSKGYIDLWELEIILKKFIKDLNEKDTNTIIKFMNGKINREDLNAEIMRNKYELAGGKLR